MAYCKTAHKGSRYRHIHTEAGLKLIFFHRETVNYYRQPLPEETGFQAIHLKQCSIQHY